MRCEEVLAELELSVLGDLSEARQREVDAHLRACPECWAAEQDYRLLLAQLRSGAGTAAPRPEFAEALRAEAGAAVRAERRRRGVRRWAAAAAAVAACLAVALGGWLLLGRAGAPGGSEALGAAEQWRFGHVRAVPASPADGLVVHGGSMYLVRAAERGNRVAAVAAATGAARWESPCESLGYLAADRERVYCLASAGRRAIALLALDAATGRLLWRREQPWPSALREPSRPVPLAGGRVCWSVNGVLHVFDAGTGEAVWTRAVAAGGLVSGAVPSGDGLFVASGTSLHCLSDRTGEELWRHRLDETASRGRPLLALEGGRAYVFRLRPASGGELLCLDVAARSVVWRRAAPEARSLLAAGGVVCLRGGSVMALDGGSGGVLWTHRAEGCGPMTHFDGLVHFVDSGERGGLVALEPRTGRPAWELPGIRSCDAFARAGGLGYIKTRDGVVHALALGGRF